MKKERHEKALHNQAIAEACEKIACANCGERLLFAMRDSNGAEFSVGLSVILQCLQQAENEKCVPALPFNWWQQVYSFYSHDEL